MLYAPATILYGPSGVGKSSLINIGLPKELAKRRGGADVTVFRWWQCDDLSTALMDRISRTLCLPSMAVHKAPCRVSDFVRFAVKHRGRPLVIVLDQFEEYFVYHPGERDCQLEAALDQIIHDDTLDVQMLFAIREDRYHLLESLRLTIPAILDNTLELGHLDEGAVREAIIKPLEVYNEQHRQGRDRIPPPRFVDRLINELRQVETGAGKAEAVASTERRIELPYLQLALEKIWKAAGGAEMRVLDDGYPAEQRISHILTDHLNKVMQGLTPGQQALCARLFDRLITRSGTKFAMSALDLAKPERGIQEDAVQDVLTRLSNQEARILTPVARPGGAAAFEIFHDVLGPPILHWKERFEAEARQSAERERLAAEASAAAAREAEARRRTRRVKFFLGALAVLFVILFVVSENLFWVARRGLPLGVLKERWAYRAYLLGKDLPLPELVQIPAGRFPLPELVKIPAGRFMMGSHKPPPIDQERVPEKAERVLAVDPVHLVAFAQPFYIGRTEVTFQEWDACVADGACRYRPSDKWGRKDRPVVEVSWEHVQHYVKWLGTKLGKECRLPSEAEWEYAARAGTCTEREYAARPGTCTEYALPAPAGSNDIKGKNLANCADCGSEWDNEETAPVGRFDPNAWELHDMHGNVWEWVGDCAHDNYRGAPDDGGVWENGGDCNHRMLRGGSWSGFPALVRSADRLKYKPEGRVDSFGFRVVCSYP